MIALLLTLSAAIAGDGPWPLGPGEQNLFLGFDYYRYGNFQYGDGNSSALPTRLTAYGATAVWTVGLREGVEGELKIPYEHVRVNDPTVDACQGGAVETWPADWCRATGGLGDVGAQVKVRALNELYGSPVSLSLSLGLRSGEAYAEHRRRLTTLGDGTTDVGAGFSVGRTDVLGRGWYRASLDGWYWYRFANAEVDGAKVPADEVSTALAALFAPLPSFGFGPAVHGFFRLGGQDVSTADFTDYDVWASLAARQLQVGLKLGLFSADNGPTVSLAVLRTVWAENNPTDTLVISAGVGKFFKPRGSR